MEAADRTNLKALFDSNDLYYCAIKKYLDGGFFDKE